MGGGGVLAIVNTMRDKHYTNKSIRIDDKVWIDFKEERRKSGKSWNLFIKLLIKKLDGKEKNDG